MQFRFTQHACCLTVNDTFRHADGTAVGGAATLFAPLSVTLVYNYISALHHRSSAATPYSNTSLPKRVAMVSPRDPIIFAFSLTFVVAVVVVVAYTLHSNKYYAGYDDANNGASIQFSLETICCVA